MADMSAEFANCLCGQPRLNPPLNPSGGQVTGLAAVAGCCAKPAEPIHTTATTIAPIPSAFRFTRACPSHTETRNYIPVLQFGTAPDTRLLASDNERGPGPRPSRASS